VRRIKFLNPRSDERFVRTVEAVIAGVTGAAQLQERLRETYPDAVVRERGLQGDPETAWYVYRDGRWVPDEGGDRPPDGHAR
jgi:hypothetical protein